MIFKFCFDNEIHRCTNPPTTYEALTPFILSMFKTGLPPNPGFYFLDENDKKVYINSEEDYQKLLSLDLSQAIKIYIVSTDVRSISISSEEVYSPEAIDDIEFHSENSSQSGYEVFESQNNLVDDKSVPSKEEIKDPANVDESDEEETKESEIKVPVFGMKKPEIVIHLEKEKEEKVEDDTRETDVAESEGVKEMEFEEEEKVEEEEEEKFEKEEGSEVIEEMVMEVAEKRVIESALSSYEIVADQETRLREIVRETLQREMSNIVFEVQGKMLEKVLVDQGIQFPIPVEGEEKTIVKEKVKKGISFLDQLKRLGRFLKETMMEIPEAAVDLVDDISQLLDKDPNLFFAGGRHPKSVIERTKKILEVFPNANVEYTLSFVKKLPKNMTADEILENYILKEMAVA